MGLIIYERKNAREWASLRWLAVNLLYYENERSAEYCAPSTETIQTKVLRSPFIRGRREGGASGLRIPGPEAVGVLVIAAPMGSTIGGMALDLALRHGNPLVRSWVPRAPQAVFEIEIRPRWAAIVARTASHVQIAILGFVGVPVVRLGRSRRYRPYEHTNQEHQRDNHHRRLQASRVLPHHKGEVLTTARIAEAFSFLPELFARGNLTITVLAPCPPKRRAE